MSVQVHRLFLFRVELHVNESWAYLTHSSFCLFSLIWTLIWSVWGRVSICSPIWSFLCRSVIISYCAFDFPILLDIFYVIICHLCILWWNAICVFYFLTIDFLTVEFKSSLCDLDIRLLSYMILINIFAFWNSLFSYSYGLSSALFKFYGVQINNLLFL